jgi:hypothetical protein
MVTIPMQVLDTKVEIEIVIFDGGEGWYLCMNTTSNVSREGMAHGENLWRILKSDPRIYGEKLKDGSSFD